MSVLQFLLLEANLSDAEAVQVTLREGGVDCKLLQVETQSAFVRALETDAFDLVLSDYALPNFDGMAALEIAHHLRPEVPFIFVSTSVGEENTIAALEAGAAGFVLKHRLERLVPCVQRVLRKAEEYRNRANLALRQNERLRAVAANLPNAAVFLVDRNFRYLLAEGKALAGAGIITEDLVGKTLWEALDPELANRYEPYYRQVLNGEPFKWEHHSHDRDYVSHGAPLYNDQGEVDAVLVVSYDITDRKRAEEQLRCVAEMDAFRVALSDAVRSLNAAAEIKVTTARVLGEYLQVDRVYYAEAEPNNEYVVIPQDYYSRGNVPSIAGRYPIRDYSSFVFREIRANRPVVIADTQTISEDSAAERDRYSAISIRALIAYPLVKANRLVAVLGATQSTPREWTEAEVALVQETAERTWAAVERAHTEDALRESEERYRTLFSSLDEAFALCHIILDDGGQPVDYRLLEVNPAFETMTGIALEAAKGKTARELIPTLEESWIETYGRVALHGETVRFENRIAAMDRWFDLYASPVGEQGDGKFVLVFTDITDRKQAEALLRQSESRFRLMVESAKDYAIFTLDLNGIITTWNAGAERLLGYLEAEVIGLSGKIIFTPEDREQGWADQEIQIALAQGQAENERWHLRKDSSCFWGSGLMMSLQDEAGNVQGLVKILQDKTTQRQTAAEREQLLQREQAARAEAERANRVKDEFLAVLSHELRSPLNPILGWTRLLQNGNLDAARQREALATIERNARLQTQLIEDLLDISRIMQGKLSLTVTSVSLTFVITAAVETVRLAAEAKNIAIVLDLSSVIAPVAGDAARLQQAVWNLLTNAVKFTPNDGQVTIELRQLAQLAQIRVIDTGKGISPSFLPHVFEYFRQADSTTTRKFGGLGLGLAIVRQIVEMHGGTVKAESEGEGMGATFTVELPLLRSEEGGERGSGENFTPLTPPHPNTPLPPPLSGLHILLVDDDADAREFQAFLLQQSGARVTAVASGFEALQAIDQFTPDVLVSDVGMSEMDGYMLMQQIQSRPHDRGGMIPAIALTAYATEVDQQRALQAGFQAHLIKPVEPEVLLSTITSLIK